MKLVEVNQTRNMVPLLVHLPGSYVQALDMLVANKLYANRSQAIRVAVLDLIKYHGFEQGRLRA